MEWEKIYRRQRPTLCDGGGKPRRPEHGHQADGSLFLCVCVGVCSIPTINRKWNLHTHCIYTHTYSGKLLVSRQADVLLNWQMGIKREWLSLRKRERERASRSRQSWLKSIVTVQVFVYMYVCLTARGMCEKTRPMDGNQTTLIAVYVEFWNVQVSSGRVETFTLPLLLRQRLCTWHTRRPRRHTLYPKSTAAAVLKLFSCCFLTLVCNYNMLHN